MKTCAEQLPIEIWILIFHYFEIHDLFKSFENLNNYFNSILSSNHLSFYVKLDKCNQFYKQFAFFSPWSNSILNRIISIKSTTKGRGKYISQFLYFHINHFHRLKSLTIEIHKQELSLNCIEFIKYNSIEYLSLACIPNEKLLEAILCSPILFKCRLYFWGKEINLNDYFNQNKTIEILYIKLKENSNNLIVNFLLSNLINLKRLEIIGDYIHQYLNTNLNKTFFILSKLEKLKLIWLRRSMNFDYFQRLLLIIPNLKYISIGIYCYKLNESLFENLITHWWPSLDQISYVKLNIKSHSLSKTIHNNQIFENYSRKILSEINNQINVSFDLKWIEENANTHTIKITIRKF